MYSLDIKSKAIRVYRILGRPRILGCRFRAAVPKFCRGTRHFTDTMLIPDAPKEVFVK